ncbi:MAG: hypothetical protein ACRD10_15035 [Terriglobia bacterium]
MTRRSLTKKQMILDYCEERQLKNAGVAEIHAIREQLALHFEKISSEYIARVLQGAGVAIGYQSRYSEPAVPEPYASSLKGKLKFGDFEEAEASIRFLDEAFRAYERAGDRTGANLARSILLKGRLRAEALAVSSKVHAQKRSEKAEIAHWFAVWLQTPQLFFDWLELRKHSEDFQRAFGLQPSRNSGDSMPEKG